MDVSEINSRRKLVGRIDRQNSRFRTAKTTIIKFGLHASFVELESAKSALNEISKASVTFLNIAGMRLNGYLRLSPVSGFPFPIGTKLGGAVLPKYASYRKLYTRIGNSIFQHRCHSNEKILGVAVALLSGDFRQTLPGIPRSTFAHKTNACLKPSFLWKNVETLHLTANTLVPLQDDQSEQIFPNQLLHIRIPLVPLESPTPFKSLNSGFAWLSR
ncbi:ATP-dependent DNA helicase [Trichonephila clavipes]|nr:ATP-dependent DNA helicase [Trichonephila clavipes]